MKSFIPHALATFAIAAISIAPVQAASESAVTFTPEPVASVSRSEGPDAELLKNIAQVLNADRALRNSKITVQLDENRNIILTGAALTVDQVKRATEVANAQAGQAKVINTILPDRQGTYTPAG